VLPPALLLDPDGDDAPPPELCDDDVDAVLPDDELDPPGLPFPPDCWVEGSEIGDALPPPLLLLELGGDDWPPLEPDDDDGLLGLEELGLPEDGLPLLELDEDCSRQPPSASVTTSASTPAGRRALPVPGTNAVAAVSRLMRMSPDDRSDPVASFSSIPKNARGSCQRAGAGRVDERLRQSDA
jgi:hypothetical protein